MPGPLTRVALVREGAEGPLVEHAERVLAAALSAQGSEVLTGKAAAGKKKKAKKEKKGKKKGKEKAEKKEPKKGPGITVALTLDPSCGLPADGFLLETEVSAREGRLRVTARDARGLLYGALDLAEWVALGYSIVEAKPQRLAPLLRIRAVELWCAGDEKQDAWLLREETGTEMLDLLSRGRYNALLLNFPEDAPEAAVPSSFLARAGERGIDVYRRSVAGMPASALTPGARRLPAFEAAFRAHQMYTAPAPGEGEGISDASYFLCRLHNEGLLLFRWGDPEFVLAAVRAIAATNAAGFVMGSPSDFLGPDPARPGSPPRFRRHWFRLLLWGRLAWDPETPGEIVWHSLFERRFGRGAAGAARTATAAASRILPLVLRFHGGAHQEGEWYPELCAARGENGRSVFQAVGNFGNKPFDPGVIGTAAYVEGLIAGGPEAPPGVLTPGEVARRLDLESARAADYAERARASRSLGAEEFAETHADWLALAHLGACYAAKIRAGVALDRFLARAGGAFLTSALNEIERAREEARAYVETALKFHVGETVGPFGPADWHEFLAGAEEDLNFVRCLRAPDTGEPRAGGPRRIERMDGEAGAI